MGRRNTRVDEMKRRAVPKMPTDKQLNSIRRRCAASSRNFAISRLLKSGNDGGDQQNTTVTTSQLNFQLRSPTRSSSRQHLHKSFARHKLPLIASSTNPHKPQSSGKCQVNAFESPTLQWLDYSGFRINKDEPEYTKAKDFGNYSHDKTKEFSQQGRNKNFTIFEVASSNSLSQKPNSYENVLSVTRPPNLKEVDSSRVRNYQDASVHFRGEEFNRHDPEKIKRGVTKDNNEGDLCISSGDFTYVSKVTVPKDPVNCSDDHRNYIVALRDLDLEQQKSSLPGSTFPKKTSGLDIPVTVIYSSSRPFLSASSRTTNISSLSSTTIPQKASGVRYVEEYNKSAGILTTYHISHAEKEDERTTSSSTSFIKEEDLDTFFLSEVLSQQSSNQFVGSEPLSSDLLSEVSELDASLSNSSILSEEVPPLPLYEAGLTTQSKLYLALLSDWEADQKGSSIHNPLPSCLKGVSVTPPPSPPLPPTPPPPPSHHSRRRLHIDLLATQVPAPPPPPPPLPPIRPPAATVVIPPKGPDRSLPPSPPPPPTIRSHPPSRPLPTPFLHPARLPPPPLPPPPPGRCSLSNLPPQTPHRVWPRLSMPAFLGKETSLLRPPPTKHIPSILMQSSRAS